MILRNLCNNLQFNDCVYYVQYHAPNVQEIRESLQGWLKEGLDIVLEYAKPEIASRILSQFGECSSSHTQLLLLKSQLSIDNSEFHCRLETTFLHFVTLCKRIRMLHF